jgi:hypothetical protein
MTHPILVSLIREIDLSELQLSARGVASRLKVTPSTLNRNTGSSQA